MINDAYDDAFMMHMRCISMLNTRGVTTPLKRILSQDLRLLTIFFCKNWGKLPANRHESPTLRPAHRGDSTTPYTS
jgi:hypothetical protein